MPSVRMCRGVVHGRSTLFLMMVLLLAPVRGTMLAGQASAAPATDLSGTWSLDIYLSDSPEQVARALQFDTGEFPAERSGRGPESAGAGRTGREGMGRGGFAGFGRPGTERRAAVEQIGPGDRKTLSELTSAVRFAHPTLTISQAATEITLEPNVGAWQTLHPNGKTEKHQVDAGTVQRTATWEGPHLMVAYDVGHAGRLTYSYSLVPTTRQLLISVNFERRPGQPGPFEIRLVYDRAPTG